MANITRRALFSGALTVSVLGLLSLTGCEKYLEDDSGKRRIAMIFNAPINDGGWGSTCYEAMVSAAEECGWETACSENVAFSDWAATMQAYIDMGYDLIYAPGNEYQDSVLQVSKDNPDARFCLLNGTVTTDNIQSAMPNATQIGQCAGALAGLLSKTEVIGFIGGIDSTKYPNNNTPRRLFLQAFLHKKSGLSTLSKANNPLHLSFYDIVL